MNATQSRKIAREKRTIRSMIEIYCRAHHATADALCAECRELLDYAVRRFERCPFGPNKPTCADCPIHCYKPAMREKIQTVMRYAGPRMLSKHPILAVFHLIDGWRRPQLV